MEVSTATALQRAAKAWDELNIAESQISRLTGYKKLNAAMKADLAGHRKDSADARKALDTVLKAAP